MATDQSQNAADEVGFVGHPAQKRFSGCDTCLFVAMGGNPSIDDFGVRRFAEIVAKNRETDTQIP